MKIYRICSSCNEEFKLPENSFFYTLETCPHCKHTNHIWIRIRDE